MKSFLLVASLAVLFYSCQNSSQNNAVSSETIQKNQFKKIDIHAHYRYPRPQLSALMKEWKMQALLVDVAIAEENEIRRSWDKYVRHAKKNPDLFYLCTAFLGDGIDDKDYADRIISQLRKEIQEGARMVKVWKNFGMVTKDESGSFIQIDDQRLQPIWDFLVQAKIPVMAHIAEPKEAWLPLNPNGTHYGYYKNHPQYHAYNFPEMPTYETIIEARDRWIANNPNLQIMCAHLGSMSHDVSMVAKRLDQFPNIDVEMGARFRDLGRQDSKTVQAFFEKYQDRILFGSDYQNYADVNEMSKEELASEASRLRHNYEILWNYLSSSDSLMIEKYHTKGIGLSEKTLKKVFYDNAKGLLQLD